jgi:hypothetical protein
MLILQKLILESKEASRLLHEYPKLKEFYDLQMGSKEIEEKEFWKQFLKKNFGHPKVEAIK